MLDMTSLAAQQHHTLTPQRTQHATEQTVGHELLQPLTVQNVGLTAGNILDVARIDQQHGEPRDSSISNKGIQ